MELTHISTGPKMTKPDEPYSTEKAWGVGGNKAEIEMFERLADGLRKRADMLLQDNNEFRKENEHLRAQMKLLEERIKELERFQNIELP